MSAPRSKQKKENGQGQGVGPAFRAMLANKPTTPYCRPLAVWEESEKSRFGRQTVTGAVEVVGKPLNFDFSHQKVLCFQGSNFAKVSFSTASLAAWN